MQHDPDRRDPRGDRLDVRAGLGAHFNPAVTFAFLLRREIAPGIAAAFVGVQIVGGLAGTWTAHPMFGEPILILSAKLRSGTGQWAGEVVATFGLVATILACLRFRKEAIPYAVGLYITAAYWFTSSTSFANPAVTIARSLSNTFAGILPGHAPAFIAARLAGAMLATWLFGWLLRPAVAAIATKDLRPAAARDLG